MLQGSEAEDLFFVLPDQNLYKTITEIAYSIELYMIGML